MKKSPPTKPAACVHPLTVTFTGGAAGLIVVAAALKGQSAEEFVAWATASMAIVETTDGHLDEQPELAALFEQKGGAN